jgi:hypothetical protein
MKFLFIDEIIYLDGDKKILIENIVFVGEATTPEGPWFPDYFVVVGDKSGVILEIPWGCSGKYFFDLINCLQSRFHIPSFQKLIDKTVFDSIVHYPGEYSGMSIYVYAEISYKRRSFSLKRILGLNSISIKVNPKLLSLFNLNEEDESCLKICRLLETDAEL